MDNSTDKQYLINMYERLGISREVYECGERAMEDLKDRFDRIDRIAECNQMKVLAAMQENRVGESDLLPTTGYGYNDEGRDKLERVYAATFHTEDALVRPQLISGTHALTVALFGILRPGDVMLSVANHQDFLFICDMISIDCVSNYFIFIAAAFIH